MSSLKRDSTAVCSASLLACLLPLSSCLKTSSTLCAFLALLTGPPVLDRLLLHKGTDVDHLSVHSLRLNLERVLVQIDPSVLPDTVHGIMVKSLAAIGELIKTAATIRSTRIVRFMHEVCSCAAEPPHSRMDRHQHQHQTS